MEESYRAVFGFDIFLLHYRFAVGCGFPGEWGYFNRCGWIDINAGPFWMHLEMGRGE